MPVRALVPAASIALLFVSWHALPALAQVTPDTIAPGRMTRVDDVPPGTNWVADARTRTYYRAGCPASASIPPADRLHYASDSLLQAIGYVKNDCTASSSTPAIASVPTPVPPAQSSPPDTRLRKGFWFSGGLGYGSYGCQDCSGREGSYSGGLALGGTLSQHVILGVGTNGWHKSFSGGATLSTATLTALVRVYPSSTGGFFLLGGLGVGSIRLEVPGVTVNESGAGALLGLGYDIRVGSNVSLTPYWNGFAVNTSNTDANVGQIGLGVTVH